MEVRILTAGDSALTLSFGNEISPEISDRVRIARDAIEGAKLPGITETIQTYCSLMVLYDPLVTDYETLTTGLSKLLADLTASGGEGRKHIIHIPVCYGGIYGPDMGNVCEHTGLSEEEVIKKHTSADYRIYMLGFLPGFAYLGGMEECLATPRLKTPREKLEAGAVGIAGSQTGIYPMESPGGWQIIGRTPVKPYDPDREVPILYEAGDYIRFFPIDEETFVRIQEDPDYTCTWEEA